MREALKLLYHELADYIEAKHSFLAQNTDIEAKHSFLAQNTDPDSALPRLFARQKKIIDKIVQVYQQLHMPSANHLSQYKRLLQAFQVALDLREQIAMSLYQPNEMQQLVQQSYTKAVLRYNTRIDTARLRVLADSIFYYGQPGRFAADAGLSALKKLPVSIWITR